MDYYRLSALAQSQDGCESRHHINAILDAAYPPIDKTRDPFEEYREREGKMFFSRNALEKHFEQHDIVEKLFTCECKDCVAARKKDPLPMSDILNRIRELPIKAPLLGLMIYLGKLHYVYSWMERGIVHERLDSVPECPDDCYLEELISSSLEQKMFRSAYRRAARMLTPVVFIIPPNNVCPHLKYHDFQRFPYVKEKLNVTQGSFGVMTKIEILDEYLDKSLLDRMKKYQSSGTRDGSGRKLLFALKSVKITSIPPPDNMERDMLNMVSRINEPASDNIITLMAYYTWKQQMHFLFPFIETDLNRLLRHGECPQGRPARLDSGQPLPEHWLWQQMKGVSRALSAIHTEMANPFKDVQGNVIALHFDLKPANILVTADGILKITDFGQSIIQIVQEDGEGTAPYNPGNHRYEPPESRRTAQDVGNCGTNRLEEIQVLPNYDVWSLACIMIEVLIHLLGQQTLVDFDERLAKESSRHFWNDDGLKKCVTDSFERFQERFADDTAQKEYMKKVVELLREMLRDMNNRVNSSEVFSGLEEAEAGFRLCQSIDAVSLKVRGYELVGGPEFRELGWHNGTSLVSFQEKDGITLDVINQGTGQSIYQHPRPCRIRIFSKPSGSDKSPSDIALVWGIESRGDALTGQRNIKPSKWCIAPRYLSETSGTDKPECVLFPQMLQDQLPDRALIFGFECPEDAQIFQGTLLQKRILPPISARVLAITPKKRRNPPSFSPGESNIQLWAKAKAKYLKAPKSNIGMSSQPPSIRSTTQPDEEQCKTMVILFKDLSPLVMTLSNGRKRFRRTDVREIDIAVYKDSGYKSYKVVQTRTYQAWKPQDPNEAQSGQFPSLSLDTDKTNPDELEEPDCFKIDSMRILLSTVEDFEQFRQGTKKEWIP